MTTDPDIVIIGAGIISLALVRRADGLRNGNAAVLALITGLFIASYSLVDGLGARLSGSSLAFFGWMALGNGLMMAAFLAVTSPQSLRDLPQAPHQYSPSDWHRRPAQVWTPR